MKTLATLFYILLFLLLLAGAATVGYLAGHAAAQRAATTAEYTCSMHPQIRQKEPGLCPICHMELVPLRQAQDAGPGIRIDPVIVQNMGLRTARIGNGPVDVTIQAFGSLRVAEPKQHEISLKVKGYVERLLADTEGVRLRRGDPLLELYAPELLLAQEELLAAKNSADPALLDAARRKLTLLDVDPAEIAAIETEAKPRRTLRFVAPADGILLQKNVVQGAAVEVGQVLFRIADLTTLWLDAQLYESQIALGKIGLPVVATVGAFPGQTFTGEVVFVGPTVDPDSRTATMRVALANPGMALKPGMYARITVRVRVAESAPLVPREAVLDTGQRQLVFVQLEPGRFAARKVVTGHGDADGRLQVLEGLSFGDVVVTSGQFLLDAESRMREGTQKLSAEGLAASRPAASRPQLLLDATAQAQLDAIVAAYLKLVDAMADDRFDEPTLAELERALTAAKAAVLAPHRDTLQQTTALLHRGDLAQRRVELRKTSNAILELVSVAMPSRARFAELTHVHCPMFPGDWLQRGAKVRNPYHGSEMLECGDLVRRIPLREEK